MITSLKIFLQSEIGIQNPNSIIKLNDFEYGPIRNGWNILFIEKEKVWLENVQEHRFSDIIEKLEDFDLALGIFQGQSYPKSSKYLVIKSKILLTNIKDKIISDLLTTFERFWYSRTFLKKILKKFATKSSVKTFIRF